MKQILIIGGGSIGERHVRCFQNTGCAEVSLCEVRDDLRSEVSQRYGLNQSFSTLDSALQGAKFDAAVVCTPAHLHIPMSLELAEYGIGLLIEKPLSISMDGIDALRSLAVAKQTPVSVAYVLRQHPALQALRSSVSAGRFGRPVQVVFTGGQHFPFYRPAYRDIYYTRHETGGGAIQDALTHMVNAVEWIVGPVTRLIADADHCVLDGVDVEDTVHMMTRHSDILGSFSLNQHQPPNESTLTVICEEGAARYEAHRSRWLSCTDPDSEWAVEDTFQIERDDLFVSQAGAFLDHLEGRGAVCCSLEDAVQTLQVSLAALKSVNTSSWVDV